MHRFRAVAFRAVAFRAVAASLLVAAGLVVTSAGPASAAAVSGAAVSAAVPVAAADCTTAATVQITSLVFDPPTVPPGVGSAARLTAQNCTAQTVQATSLWVAHLVGSSGTGIPPGCPAVDPVALPATLPPNGQVTSSLTYQLLPSCTATALQLTVQITAGGVVLASQSATLTFGTAAPTCAVTYTRQSEWSGGFVASVTVTNTATTAVTGWVLAFAFPGDQHVTNAWNATVAQTGSAVTATNLAHNRVIAAGASVSFGFQGTWQASDAAPTAFTLNASACAVR